MSSPRRNFAVVLFCLTFLHVIDSTVIAQQMLGQRVKNRFLDKGPVVSENFIVYAPDRLMAAKVSQAAEGFRKSLASEWLGRELPAWRQKCPITVKIEPHAGGETSFAFQMDETNRGAPVDWEMKIFGPPQRILDAVLPHEITHTIFATHFGRPLPRWADEGACTTVEHVSERKKNHQMLLEFLTTSRGIPFNRMYTMKQYPQDILPLYAQGYSLAKYLIFQKGKRHFLNYIDRGMQYDEQGGGIVGWNRATSEFYGFDNLSDLQLSWVAWVRDGSKETAAAQLAKAAPEKQATPIQPAQTFASAPPKNVARGTGQVRSLMDTDTAKVAFSNSNDSWYASQMRGDATARAAGRAQATHARKASLKATPVDLLDLPSLEEPAEPRKQKQSVPVRNSRLTSPSDLKLR
ncbi:hypothetical protein N9Y42_00250 [Mariniblastus sp.]|nr:hypothetical protein [Mariniblastus sp.]